MTLRNPSEMGSNCDRGTPVSALLIPEAESSNSVRSQGIRICVSNTSSPVSSFWSPSSPEFQAFGRHSHNNQTIRALRMPQRLFGCTGFRAPVRRGV